MLQNKINDTNVLISEQTLANGQTPKTDKCSLSTVDLIDKLEKLKEKYNRLKVLKGKNDEKLITAKKRLDDLKNKTGLQLLHELGILNDDKETDKDDLIKRKREQAIKGSFKMPKMKSKFKSRKNHNVSIVQEIAEEEVSYRFLWRLNFYRPNLVVHQ